jgi:signal transduction histidine kinase
MKTPLRVLLVEDSEPDAVLLVRRLNATGFSVTSHRVETAETLKASLADQDWDVVISDFRLPHFSGSAALELLQASGRDIPFILVSGAVGEEQAVAVMKAGAHDFLLKDRLARLAPAVSRAIGDAEARRRRKQAETELRELNAVLEQRVNERTAEAQQLAERLRALASELLHVEQRERRKLAEVLHDHIQQMLVAARLQVNVATVGTKADREGALQHLDALMNESIQACRSLAVELSPPVLYQSGLIPALEWVARKFTDQYQVDVALHADPDAEPLDDDVRVLLYSCTRELLLNVIKHAGVRSATIRLRRAQDKVTISVEDQGKGFNNNKSPEPGGGFGLFSIEQRLAFLGGTMHIETAPGMGTRVHLTLRASTAASAA